MSYKKGEMFFVFFPTTKQKFPIRYMQTSDLYEVDLPAGIYEAEKIDELKKELKSEFTNVRITR